MAVRYEIAVGLNKGHKTTKIRRVTYKGDKKVKGLRGSNVKNVRFQLISSEIRSNIVPVVYGVRVHVRVLLTGPPQALGSFLHDDKH